jgi:hypothetical protein
MRIPYISLVAAGALALGGCAYGDLGMGLGYGYGSPYYGSPYYGYGYGSPYYGAGYYGSPYYGGSYYGGLGYGGFGSPFGWYDNYYYPGTGYYVYDSYRRPHVMTTTQRAYWTRRSPALRTSSTSRVRPNWSGFNRHDTTRADRQTAREERQQAREERRRNSKPD